MTQGGNRIQASYTSISWIPSEAIVGLARVPFDLGIGHYDEPPPDVVDDIETLYEAGGFRFANRLRAWIHVADGEIVAHGHSGHGYINRTLLRFAGVPVTFQPTAFPELRPPPAVGAGSVRFVQTTGGRAGVPAPRRVRDRPFFQWVGPTVWTTLSLTVNADGTSSSEMIGASTFPRHWLYDDSGQLVAKSGMVDFESWYRGSFGSHSPWGDEDTPAFVAMAETALERQLSTTIMKGNAKPEIASLPAGSLLFHQGEPGRSLYLVLDGVLEVEVDNERVAQVGPGAVVGERAILDQGMRTATLRAVIDCRLAEADVDAIDRAALIKLAMGHRREGT